MDPETRISFLFAMCRPTQTRYGVDPFIGLSYALAARTGVVVCPAAVAAADTTLDNRLTKIKDY